MTQFTLRPVSPADLPWIRQFWIDHWGDEYMVINGELITPTGLPGFAAEMGGEVVGLATYRLQGSSCELLSIDALLEGKGIGTTLLNAVIAAARAAGCSRLHLVTTNDNLKALHFYQTHSFHLCALRPGAIVTSRALKPSIPLLGNDSIPLRDEIVLEMAL